MTKYISIPDYNDSFSRVVLDGKELLLRFTYNTAGSFWCFGVYELDETPIVASVKIVPNTPLNLWYIDSKLPFGTFGVITDKEVLSRNSFVNNEAVFAFIPHADIGVTL